MAAQKKLQPGDRVTVPWGLYEVVGTVQYAYGPAAHQSVVVRVPILGPLGEPLGESSDISFPADALNPVAAA
jgi:hypothetical protein